MRCSNCGRDIDESVFSLPLTYCPYCGQNLGASGTAEGAAESVHFCPHCGKELPGTVKFCPYCGGEIGSHIAIHHTGLEGGEPAKHRAIIEPPPEHTKKSGKLYKQWVKYANLPPDAIPTTETPTNKPLRQDVTVGLGENIKRIPVLYIVIGVCVIALFVLIIILIAQSC